MTTTHSVIRNGGSRKILNTQYDQNEKGIADMWEYHYYTVPDTSTYLILKTMTKIKIKTLHLDPSKIN